MKAILFVKLQDGRYLFKTDTFWHRSTCINRAKVYGDHNFVKEPLLDGVIKNNINDIEDVLIYDKSILGYFTPDSDKFEGRYSLKDDLQLDDLGDPTYLYIIDVKPLEEWNINNDNEGFILTEGNYSIRDFREYKRNEILTEILN
jgi:hypothetical protein